MTPSMKYFTHPILLGAALTLSGCLGGSSEDDTASKAPGVPANAITITATNAEATLKSAVVNKDLALALGTVSAPNITLEEALELVKKIRQSSNAVPATAAGVTETQNCPGGGTQTYTFTSSGNTDSGSMTLSNCVEDGFTINGTLSYSDKDDGTVYSRTASGNLSVASIDISVSFSGFDFAANGNYNSMTYTITKFTFALDVTANGRTGGGFLTELTVPIVESTGGLASCPESGAIKITGASSTTAELIYNGDGTVTIKANGAVVNSAATCA